MRRRKHVFRDIHADDLHSWHRVVHSYRVVALAAAAVHHRDRLRELCGVFRGAPAKGVPQPGVGSAVKEQPASRRHFLAVAGILHVLVLGQQQVDVPLRGYVEAVTLRAAQSLAVRDQPRRTVRLFAAYRAGQGESVCHR